MNTAKEDRTSTRRLASKSAHRARRNVNATEMDYKEAIIRLLPKIRDDKLVRRVWRLLDTAYNEQ